MAHVTEYVYTKIVATSSNQDGPLFQDWTPFASKEIVYFDEEKAMAAAEADFGSMIDALTNYRVIKAMPDHYVILVKTESAVDIRFSYIVTEREAAGSDHDATRRFRDGILYDEAGNPLEAVKIWQPPHGSQD